MRTQAILSDLRHAFRLFGASRTSGVVAICSLTLGIAAATITLGVANQLLIKPRTVLANAGYMALFETTSISCPQCLDAFSRESLESWARSGLQSFDVIGSYRESVIKGSGESGSGVGVAYVDTGFFRAHGVKPARGRLLSATDRDIALPSAVVSYGFWRSRLGGAAIGTDHSVGNTRVRLVGILPAGFRFPEGAQIWLPDAADSLAYDRASRSLLGVARLRNGVSPVAAAAEVNLLSRRLMLESGDTLSARGVVALRPDQLPNEASGSSVWVVLAAALATFFAACVNLGSLFLVRSLARSREFCIRSAIGASRTRLVQQLAVETGVTSVLGVLLAVALVTATAPLVNRYIAATFGLVDSVVVDAVLVAAALLLGVIAFAIILLASLPLAREAASNSALRGGHVAAPKHRRLRGVFVGVQVVAAFVLLAASLVLTRSYSVTRSVASGVRKDAEVAVAEISFDNALDKPVSDPRSIASDLDSRLATSLGRSSVGLWSMRWLDTPNRNAIILATDDREVPARPDLNWPRPYPLGTFDVTPSVFEVLGMTLRTGRTFTEADRSGTEPVVILNEAAARELWPSGPAVGRRIKLGGHRSTEPWLTVVGVVSNTCALLYAGLDFQLVNQGSMPPLMFRPLQQTGGTRFTVAVRTGPGAARARLSLDETIRGSIPPNGKATASQPMREWLTDSPRFRRVRAVAQLFPMLAAAGVLIVLVGVYGLVADMVRSRTVEIGVRITFGAQDKDIVQLIGRDVGRLAVIAVATGLVSAVALARVTRIILYGYHPSIRTGLLFGTSANDPGFLALACFSVLVVCGIAAAGPVRRALKVPPIVSLRAEG